MKELLRILLFAADEQLERISKTKLAAWATALAALVGPFVLAKLGIEVDLAHFEQFFISLFALVIIFLREGIDRAVDQVKK